MASGTFNQWLDTYVDEKGLDRGQILEAQGKEWGLNLIELQVVINAMKSTCKAEQDKIKDVLVAIDVRNGDPMHFINHLAKAIAV